MKINWCFKGIQQSAAFDDNAALATVYDRGIQSSYLFNQSLWGRVLGKTGHDALDHLALYRHVHDYDRVRQSTPYISVSSGIRQFAGAGVTPVTHGALETAIVFATDFGLTEGYIFSCWVITSLKPVPEIPGLAEDIRDLNLFGEFSTYNHEGELAAKLVIPSRQIEWVAKVDRFGNLQPFGHAYSIVHNHAFVPPDRLSNVFMAVS